MEHALPENTSPDHEHDWFLDVFDVGDDDDTEASHKVDDDSEHDSLPGNTSPDHEHDWFLDVSNVVDDDDIEASHKVDDDSEHDSLTFSQSKLIRKKTLMERCTMRRTRHQKLNRYILVTTCMLLISLCKCVFSASWSAILSLMAAQPPFPASAPCSP